VTNNGSIQGTVVLDGETVHSGITVLLYVDNTFENDLKQICEDYPSVGFPIESRHLFDHRMNTPIKETITADNGFYSFTDVPHGKYIVVYYKVGWGYNYLFDIELNNDLYTITNECNSLFATIQVPFINHDEYHFLADRCYLIEGDSFFLSDSSIYLEQGTRILVAPNSKITIGGNLFVTANPGSMIHLTSSDQIYEYNISPLVARSIEILPSANFNELSHLMLSYFADGLIIRASDTTIKNSVFYHNTRSCYFENSVNHDFCNNFVMNNLVSIPAVGFQQGNNVRIERNCFLDNHTSLKLDLTYNSLVRNNLFTGGELHIDQVYSSSGLIEFNDFKQVTRSISNSSKSNMTIQFNQFESDVCIFLGTGDFNTIDQGWTKANSNNFSANSYVVEATTKYYYSNNDPYPLDFTNNYWSTSTITDIPALIYDMNDAGPSSDEWNWARVDYIPIRTSQVPTAGIQPL
jgi:hypothetical protein